MLPSASLNVPGGHEAHSADPSVACVGSMANVPAEQTSQLALAGFGAAAPAGHATHETLPCSSVNVPGSHASHIEDASSAAKKPGAHKSHRVLPVCVAAAPGAHGAHAVSPKPSANLPAGQISHRGAPAIAETLPGVHSAHSNLPASGPALPAGHVHSTSEYAAASTGSGQANAPRASLPAPRASTTSARTRSIPNASRAISAPASIALGSRGNSPPNALFATSSVSSEACVRKPASGIDPTSALSRRSSVRRLGSAENKAAGSVPFKPHPRACRWVNASRLAPATPNACGNVPNARIPEMLSRFKRANGRIACDDKGPVMPSLPSTRSDSRSSRRLSPSQSSSDPASALPSSRTCESESRWPSHRGIAPAMPLFASESAVKLSKRSSAAGNAASALNDRSSRSRCAAKVTSSKGSVCRVSACWVSFDDGGGAASGNASTPSNPFRARYSDRSDGSASRDDGTTPVRLFRDRDRRCSLVGQRKCSVSAGNSPDSRLCDRSSSTRLGSAKSDRGTAPSSPRPRRCRCVSRVNFESVSFEGKENEASGVVSDDSVPPFPPLSSSAAKAASSTSTVSPSLSSSRPAQVPIDSGTAPTSAALPLKSTRRVYGPQIPDEGRLPRSAFERKRKSLTRLCAIHSPPSSSVSNALEEASTNVRWDKHETSGNVPANAFPWISMWSRNPVEQGFGNAPLRRLCARRRRIKYVVPNESKPPLKSFSLTSTSRNTG